MKWGNKTENLIKCIQLGQKNHYVEVQELIQCSFDVKEILTLQTLTPQNGQTHSNNLSANS